MVEVGLGGRYDATNVIVPAVSAITNIDLDHQRHLGDTIAAIAAEKAGIAKPGVPLVVGAVAPRPGRSIAAAAAGAGAPLVPVPRRHDRDRVGSRPATPSCGSRPRGGRIRRCGSDSPARHQVGNAAVAVRVLETLEGRRPARRRRRGGGRRPARRALAGAARVAAPPRTGARVLRRRGAQPGRGPSAGAVPRRRRRSAGHAGDLGDARQGPGRRAGPAAAAGAAGDRHPAPTHRAPANRRRSPSACARLGPAGTRRGRGTRSVGRGERRRCATPIRWRSPARSSWSGRCAPHCSSAGASSLRDILRRLGLAAAADRMTSRLLACLVLAATLGLPRPRRRCPATTASSSASSRSTRATGASPARSSSRTKRSAGQKFYANVVDLYTDDDRVEASGNVVYETATARVAAERAVFFTRAGTGTFYNASGLASLGEKADRSMFGALEPDVYFYGEILEKTGEDRYKITKGGFTTCVQPTPRWELVSRLGEDQRRRLRAAEQRRHAGEGRADLLPAVDVLPDPGRRSVHRLPAALLRAVALPGQLGEQRVLLGDDPQPGPDRDARLVHPDRPGLRHRVPLDALGAPASATCAPTSWRRRRRR